MPHPRLTEMEDSILTTIVYLSQQLPKPLDDYVGHLARIRRRKLGTSSRSRGEVTKGYIDGHQTRATEPWKTRKEYEDG